MTFTFDDFMAFGGSQAMEETGETADAHDYWRKVFGMLLRPFKVLYRGHVSLEDHAALFENGLEDGVKGIGLGEGRVEVPHARDASEGACAVQ